MSDFANWILGALLIVVFATPLPLLGYAWALRGTPGVGFRLGLALASWLIMPIAIVGTALGCMGGGCSDRWPQDLRMTIVFAVLCFGLIWFIREKNITPDMFWLVAGLFLFAGALSTAIVTSNAIAIAIAVFAAPGAILAWRAIHDQ